MEIKILLNYLTVENSIHFERKDTFQSIPNFSENKKKVIKLKVNKCSLLRLIFKISYSFCLFIFDEFVVIKKNEIFNSLPPDDLCYSVLNSYLSNHYISMVTRTMLAYDFCFVFITLSA